MTKGSNKTWKYAIFLVVILAIAEATVVPSFGEVILLHTQEPYSISDNKTLVAEDVDPSAGVVWLKLYNRNETLKSSLLGVGGHFDYDHINLTVNKIYAGGERDLVELGLNNSSAVKRSKRLISADVSTNASKNVSLNLTSNTTSPGPSRIPKRSPGFEVSTIPMILLAYRLTNPGRFRN
jgi:hypothetical protein